MGEGKSGDDRQFGLSDFLVRLAAALALVLVTYNPLGWSYVHWVRDAYSATEGGGLGAIHFFAGALLLAGWTVFLVATKNSLGMLGTIISVAVIGTAIWLLADLGVVHADSASAVAWLVLIALAVLLAVGLSWSHAWRRLSGQLEVDSNDG